MSNLTNLPCTAVEFGELSAELLRLGKGVRFQARGSSMRPLVREDDFLLIQPVELNRIHVGDVLLCSGQSGQIVVHRVIRRHKKDDDVYLLVQGDQSPHADGWIPASRVFGRLDEVTRRGKTIKMQNSTARFLGLLAVMNNRSNGRMGWLKRVMIRMLKQLPGFCNYLV